jgi:hypothetical protein
MQILVINLAGIGTRSNMYLFYCGKSFPFPAHSSKKVSLPVLKHNEPHIENKTFRCGDTYPQKASILTVYTSPFLKNTNTGKENFTFKRLLFSQAFFFF